MFLIAFLCSIFVIPAILVFVIPRKKVGITLGAIACWQLPPLVMMCQIEMSGAEDSIGGGIWLFFVGWIFAIGYGLILGAIKEPIKEAWRGLRIGRKK